MDNANTKHRIQFDITQDALAELDKLVVKANTSTRAEAVRNALKFYAWYLSKKKDGFDFLVRKGDDEWVVELL